MQLRAFFKQPKPLHQEHRLVRAGMLLQLLSGKASMWQSCEALSVQKHEE